MKTFSPRAEVRLLKTARRSELGAGLQAAARYQQLESIDLTPYLMEQTPIDVVQYIGGGAGTWSMTLADRMMPEYKETLYALIEPMDMIEIRMARSPHEYQGKSGANSYKLPVTMRGFVSNIERHRSMSGGAPVRRIQVSGHDFGKILDILRIYYLNNSAIGDNILGELKFFHKYAGLDQAKIMGADEFVRLVLDKLINPFIDRLTVNASGDKVGAAVVRKLAAEVSIEGTVSPLGVSLFSDGSVRQFLDQFLDVGAFNELFVDDREDASVLVVRPNKFLNLSNEAIQGAATPAPTASPGKDNREAELAAANEELAKAKAEWKVQDDLHWKLLADTQDRISRRDQALAAGDRVGYEQYQSEAEMIYRRAQTVGAEAKALFEKVKAAEAKVAALQPGGTSAPATLPGAAEAVVIPDVEIESMVEGRSDGGVANYFWVANSGWQVMEDITVKQLAAAGNAKDYALFDYINTNPARYGFRKMEVTSSMGPSNQSYGEALTADQSVSETDKRIAWLTKRRKILAEQNKDNAVLEFGHIAVQGNERIRRGMYVALQYGDYQALYYVTSVRHRYVPFQSFKTILSFERGTGFVVRAQRAAGAYLAELNMKGAV